MKLRINLVSGLTTIQFFHGLAENINYIFITLYIWKNFSITSVIQFRLYELILVPFSSLMVGYLLDRVSSKFTFGIGLFSLFLQLALILYLGENTVNYLIPIAILSGLSTKFRFLSLNVINQNSVVLKDQISYFSKLNIQSKITSIIFPIVSGLFVFLLGYNFIFLLALACVLVMGFLLFHTPIKTNINSYKPFAVYKNWDREKSVLFGVNFFWGIEYALFATLIPIVVTIMFNGELGWGIITSILGILSVGFSIFFKKSELLNKSIFALVVLGFLITISSIFFVSNVNIYTFLIFMVFLQLWQSTQMMGLKPILNKIIQHEPQSNTLSTEFSVFMEFPFMIGQFLLLLILYIIGSELENLSVVGFLFAVLGFVPFYESKFISHSKQAIEKIVNLNKG